jgi:hypothetical protein
LPRRHTIAVSKSSGFFPPLHALLTFIRALLKEITMTESATAEIIPFPSRSIEAATANAAAPSQPAAAVEDTRLTRALANLNDALTAQRAAVAAWKSSLGELGIVTGRLGATMRGYNESLGHLDGRVATLREEAVKLEAWADGAMTQKG